MAQFDMPLSDLERYLPEIDEPADFDEFWSTTLAEARTFDEAPKVERIDVGLTEVVVDDVTFPGFGGHPVKAWLTRPAHADGDLPVVVEYEGYGGGRGLPHEKIHWAAAGYAHLTHGQPRAGLGLRRGRATPDPVGSGPAQRPDS